MLPKCWQDYLLGEIVTFKNGLNFTRTAGGEKIKIVGVSDFKNRTQLSNTNDLDVISVSDKVRDSELLVSGDLLFVRSNGNRQLIGRCLYFPIIKERLAFSGFTIRGRVDKSIIEPEFASYLMRSSIVTNQIFLGGSGTNISNLSQERLSNIRVCIPPKSEQRRIANILATWDEVIAAVERLLANSRRQKQALMRRLLNSTADSESWKSYLLGDLFKERVEPGRNNLPLLSITRELGVILREDVGRKDTSNEDKSKYLRICPGDIGYNTMRMWQGVSALSMHEGIVSPAYTIIVPDEKIDARYAAHLFKLDSMVFTFYRHSQGLVSDTWSLKFKHFEKISVTIPSLQAQGKIVTTLAEADEIISKLSQKINCLQREKAALMQQLLMGRYQIQSPKIEEEKST